LTRIEIPPNFKKVMGKKEPAMQGAIAECIDRLFNDPTHPGLRVHKMRGQGGVWEAYIDKGNRLTFERDGDLIRLRNNCNHDMLSRNP